MHNALNAWADKLQHVVLPALPASVESLAALCGDDNVRTRTLASAAEQDPGLTLALLRRASEGGARRLRSEVTTAEHAIMMLGLARVRRLPASVPLLRGLDPRVRTRIMRLIARAQHAAHQAREIGRRRKDIESDELFLAALLHNLSALLLWLRAPASMARIEELTRRQSTEPEEAQYVTLGFGLDHLSLELMRRWGLPTLLQDSFKGESAQSARLYSAMLAIQLARAAERGWYRAETTAVVERIADYLGMTWGDTAAFLHRNAVEAAQAANGPEPPAAASLLLLPSAPEAAPSREPTAQTAWAEATPQSGRSAAERAVFCLAPQLHILRQASRTLQASTGDIQGILSLAMDGLHDGTGLNRVVFAQLIQERHRLRARAIAGADNDPVFNRFAIELTPGSLFSWLMDRPLAIWIDDRNRAKFWPMVPAAFQRLVRSNSFFAASVFVSGRPVGMFYADRHAEGCRLDSRAYHRFKQLTQQCGRAMERASGVRS